MTFLFFGSHAFLRAYLEFPKELRKFPTKSFVGCPKHFCDFRVFFQSIEFDYGRTKRARAMKFFLWGCGVIIFDAAKFERRSFRRSGDTARAKLRIYYASNI